MKTFVTQYHALDIADLIRGGYLYPFCRFDWVWRTKRDTPAATVAVTMLQDALQLLVLTDAEPVKQEVRLTHSLSPGGGKRRWFSCPTCQRRVGVLYHLPTQLFQCRRCWDLAYPSQYESKRHGQGRCHRIINNPEGEGRKW
ncbi:MAG TPA: hypothetical protein VN666_14225 [Nitrospira sp.]|nr:hypothetical protein [Nitrospira sp.]